jgi:hypothetical protein
MAALRILSRNQIQRIEAFRIARRLDIVQLKLAMDAPFKWQTLLRALRGLPIKGTTHMFLLNWLSRFSPKKLVFDGKAAAANDFTHAAE